MAKNYSEVYSAVYTKGNSMSFGNAMLRGNGVPLDITEVYDSYNKAVLYAAENAVAYEGQLLAVTENGDTTVYVITPALQDTITIDMGEGITTDVPVYIKEVGSVPEADGKTIEVVDGVLKLVGLDGLDSTKTYQPVLVNGKIDWQLPSATTVEGLDTRLTAVEGKVETLEETVGNAEAGLVKDVADAKDAIAENAADIKTLQEGAEAYKAADTALKTELKDYVATEIGKQAHFSAQVVTSTEAMTDATTLYLMKTAENGDDMYEEWMLIDGTPTKIGTTATDLRDYATSAQVATDIAAAKTSLQAMANTNANAITALQTTTGAQDTRIGALETVGAEKNVINSASAEFTITEDRELSVNAIEKSKITDLNTDLATLQGTKVDKKSSIYKGEDTPWTLLSPENAAKLGALTIGDAGNIEISGKVNAANVEGLEAYITGNRDSIAGLYSSADATKLASIASGAQVNVIEKIKINGAELPVGADKSVNIPFATNNTIGVVLSSDAENKIAVGADGTMEVNSLNVNKLTQTDGDTLILNGGHA